MIGHNSWTDWAREPVKTSLDSKDSTESNEFDKQVPLHLKCLEKFILCINRIDFLAIFRENKKNSFPVSILAFSIRFLRFEDLWRTQ